MSCLIGEPFALGRTGRDGHPLSIVDAELEASVLPEIELGKVAVQVLFIDVLINAD